MFAKYAIIDIYLSKQLIYKRSHANLSYCHPKYTITAFSKQRRKDSWHSNNVSFCFSLFFRSMLISYKSSDDINPSKMLIDVYKITYTHIGLSMRTIQCRWRSQKDSGRQDSRRYNNTFEKPNGKHIIREIIQ